ncbi:MAG: response regulator [Elusimicrobia bacterium]|nr:response regulator [Elusimicrobiota bacterium]MDE2425590.1 response regulator [Elusimicrobiota bacterium]
MVDDDGDFQAVVREWICARYEHVALSDGEGLEELLESLAPDLLILDVRMPGLDGFKLCKRLRADERYAELPVLFLTACKEDADFLSNLEAGGTAYLTKPVARKDLLRVMGELTALSGAGARTS